jgi:hypothetical protein
MHTDTRWLLHEDLGDDGFRHVFPAQDSKEHQLEGVECWCKPEIDMENDMVIHNRVQ